MTIGDRIKNRRIQLGLTAEELGIEIGKNKATVYRYENGDIENLPTSILEPLSLALSTTPDYLMGWTDNPDKNYLDYLNDTILPKKEHLKNKPTLERINKILEKNDQMVKLFDTAADLDDADIEQVLKIMETFKKE